MYYLERRGSVFRSIMSLSLLEWAAVFVIALFLICAIALVGVILFTWWWSD